MSSHEQVEWITSALTNVASGASVCRSFKVPRKVPRSTLIDTLKRSGWNGAGKV